MPSCPYCTAQIAPGLYQCPNCGSPLMPAESSLPPATAQSALPPQPVYSQPPMYPADVETIVPMRSWIGYVLLCSCLPVIGPVIALCTAKEKNVQNYAKAMLLMAAIAAAALFLLILFVLFLDFMF